MFLRLTGCTSLNFLYYPEIVFSSEVERKKFWFLHLIPGGGGVRNFFVSSSIWFFKYIIWEAKLRKVVPSMLTLKIDFIHMLKNLVAVSGQAKDDLKCTNFAIRRYVGHGGGP